MIKEVALKERRLLQSRRLLKSRRLEKEPAGTEWEEERFIKILRRVSEGRKTAGRGHIGRARKGL